LLNQAADLSIDNVPAHGRVGHDTQGRIVMILVTRLNGPVFALNPDLVERADCTPDTVITLVDGTKYVIAESVPEFIELVRRYRVSLIAQAQRIDSGTGPDSDPADDDGPDGATNVVHLHRRER
jgi:flagellar protein FlbD